ncbi:MAG: hypothetical protein HW415_1101 [Deltaproteobacteria bacterium]|nr:hypothetical protein [Deltaproteobacteria bacterium]
MDQILQYGKDKNPGNSLHGQHISTNEGCLSMRAERGSAVRDQ